MKTKTINLDKETYLLLFKFVSDELSRLKDRADLSCYSPEELDERSWRVDEAKKASESLPGVQKLYDAILFGEV